LREKFKDKGFELELQEKYLFSIDAKFEGELNQNISEELKDKFETKGFSISKNPIIAKKDDNWAITDGEKIYIVKKEDGKLNIYQENAKVRAIEHNKWKIQLNIYQENAKVRAIEPKEAVQQFKIGRKRRVNRVLNPKRSKKFSGKNIWVKKSPYIIEKEGRNLKVCRENYFFVDTWVLVHLVLAIVIFALWSSIQNSILGVVFIAMGIYRVYEYFIYQTHAVLFELEKTKRKARVT